MTLTEKERDIVRGTLDILGEHVKNEWTANVGMLLQTVARSNDSKPAGVEEQIALNYFFMKALETYWGINEEILELDIKKAFIQMGDIVKDTRAKFAPPPAPEPPLQGEVVDTPPSPVIPDGVGGGELSGLASMFNALCGNDTTIPPMGPHITDVIEDGNVVPFKPRETVNVSEPNVDEIPATPVSEVVEPVSTEG